jgi:hypothetical protein
VRSQWRECTGSREQGEVRFKLPMPSPPERAWVSRPVPRPIKVWSSLRPAPAWARPRCKLNARILLANLFLCDRAAVAALDSPCSWAFNDGIGEAHLRHFGVRQQYPGVFTQQKRCTVQSKVPGLYCPSSTRPWLFRLRRWVRKPTTWKMFMHTLNSWYWGECTHAHTPKSPNSGRHRLSSCSG